MPPVRRPRSWSLDSQPFRKLDFLPPALSRRLGARRAPSPSARPTDNVESLTSQSSSSQTPYITIQNIDSSLDSDVVIITSLPGPTLPFCCHADLLLMRRSELIRTAQLLNARLPVALAISCGGDMPETAIILAIEQRVGIRRQGPGMGRPMSGHERRRSMSELENGSSNIPTFQNASKRTSGKKATSIPMNTLVEQDESSVILGTPPPAPHSNPRNNRSSSQLMISGFPVTGDATDEVWVHKRLPKSMALKLLDPDATVARKPIPSPFRRTVSDRPYEFYGEEEEDLESVCIKLEVRNSTPGYGEGGWKEEKVGKDEENGEEEDWDQ